MIAYEAWPSDLATACGALVESARGLDVATDDPSGKERRVLEEADTATPADVLPSLTSAETLSAAGGAGPGAKVDGDDLAILEPGAKIGRFVVVRQLGAGGMGVVLAAQDPLLDRKVAVKLLRPRSFGDDAVEKAKTRLLREAQAMAKLSHSNVLPVFDAGDLGDRVFIAMELVDGENLDQWLKQEKRSWREVLDVFIQAGRGLAAAHRAGLVHRDFKPANVLVGRSGSVRVADFGLVGTSAQVLSTASLTNPGARSISPDTSLDDTLTHTGTLLGTPCYMAPEQHLGQETDTRADQFSFCVAMYQALYGQRPFAGTTYEALSTNVLAGNLRAPPARTDVPAWVGEIVARGLCRERDDRYPSMKALLADLEHDPAAVRRHRLAMGGIAAVILALAAGLVFALTRSGAPESDPCADIESELAGIWDDAVRAHVEQSLLGSGRPHAGETFKRVVRTLDEYVAGWTSARKESCEATRRPGGSSAQLANLRAVCLDQRRDELAAVTAMLSEKPDPDIADNAILFAADLTRVDSCTQEGSVPVMAPIPEDPELRAQVVAVRKELARARFYNESGEVAKSLEVARSVLDRARALGYAPLEAEALFWVAIGEPSDEGTQHRLREALALAERARHDRYVAWARILLLVRMNPERDDIATARAQAEAAVERAGNDPAQQADLMQITAFLMQQRGDREQWRAFLSRALAMRKRAHPPDHPEVALALSQLGWCLMNTGRVDEAQPYLERALAISEKRYGISHPATANALTAMGWLQLMRGNDELAERFFERALASYEAALGPDYATLTSPMIGLINIYLGQQNEAKARRMIARWSARIEKSGEYDPTPTGFLGTLELSLGNAEKAVAVCAKEVAVAKEHQMPEGALYLIFDCLGRAYLELGQRELAVEWIQRALKVAEEGSWPSGELNAPMLRFQLAGALWDLGRERDRALVLAEQARDELRTFRDRGYGLGMREFLEEVTAWLQERGRK